MIRNVFYENDCQEIIKRIEKLSPNSQPLWGVMSVSQMLAHCNVAYETVYTEIHPKPKGLMKLVLKLIVKPTVVGNKPYKKSLRTAPMFLIKDEKNFEQEKRRLIVHINDTCKLGSSYFEGKESHSFGKLSSSEWNNMFYKHLDHHLSQFGV